MKKNDFRVNLFKAIENGDANDVRYCILEGIKSFDESGKTIYPSKGKNILNIKDQTGKTPLMLASELGNVEAVMFLLQYGASVNECDNKGRTALVFASKYGHVDVALELIENKAGLDVCTKNKRSALHYASRYGHGKVAKLLVEHGADVYLRDDRGMPAIMVASSNEVREAIIEGKKICMQNRIKSRSKNKALLKEKRERG